MAKLPRVNTSFSQIIIIRAHIFFALNFDTALFIFLSKLFCCSINHAASHLVNLRVETTLVIGETGHNQPMYSVYSVDYTTEYTKSLEGLELCISIEFYVNVTFDKNGDFWHLLACHVIYNFFYTQ